tara:strand:+ start:2070 stop:3098 length:1029 start_codon:yes stop_codon:yes gene_type:complete
MKNQIRVIPLENEHLEDVGKLLVQRIESEYQNLPGINEDFLDTGHTIEYIVNQKNDELAQSYVAVQGEKVIGFVTGKKNPETNNSWLSRLSVPHSAGINFLAHAISESVDARIVYRELYKELAKEWVAAGYTHHTTHVAACDQRAQDAWIDLGFGRHTTISTRSETGPISVEKANQITIKQANLTDLDTVVGLAEALGRHHLSSPMFMFWPVDKEDRPLAETFFTELLREEKNPHFLAYDGKQAIGMLSFLSQGLIPEHIKKEKNLYLFMGIVTENSQNSGSGHALLDEGMNWAREHNYESSTLHVLNMNYSGQPFWEATGFQPVEYSMERTIDSRLIKSKP